MELTKEDRLLIAKTEDLRYRSEKTYSPVTGPFLDMRQRSMVQEHFRGAKDLAFIGGHEDAERVMPVFCEYEVPEEDLIKAVRVTLPKGAFKLSHRDYLGSLMGLGITREKTGDILVYDTGADIILDPGILDFVLNEFTKVRNEHVQVSEIPLSELHVSDTDAESVRCFVSSLRLDNVVSAVFCVSRTKASDAIRQGLVFVNDLETLKADHRISDGDKIVMRRKGRAIVRETGDTSRKGRIIVKVDRYM